MSELPILVVDDHAAIQELLRLWLESQGHAVTCVGSGNQAMRKLAAHSYRLVVTDIVMPDGDGIELIRSIRQAHPDIGVLAISGGGPHMASPTCLELAQRGGADALLLKPFRQQQFLRALDYVLQQSQRKLDSASGETRKGPMRILSDGPEVRSTPAAPDRFERSKVLPSERSVSKSQPN